MRRSLIGTAGFIMLAACGEASETQNSVGRLENAAEQSTPAARQVLLNEAERLERENVQLPTGDPASPVQAAINKAANAQTAADQGVASGSALPRRPGDPVPPPKAAPQR